MASLSHARERTEHACSAEFDFDGVRTEVSFITVARVDWHLDRLLDDLEDIDSPNMKAFAGSNLRRRPGSRV
jgi:hypothetical protein